jgi:hypothetical protein
LSVTRKLEDLFLPDRYGKFKSWCDWEMSNISQDNMEYLLELFRRKIKVENECNSMVAYCMGLADSPPERRCELMSGEPPDI